MANEVKTVFTADATPLMAVADRVEARLKAVGRQVSSFGTPSMALAGGTGTAIQNPIKSFAPTGPSPFDKMIADERKYTTALALEVAKRKELRAAEFALPPAARSPAAIPVGGRATTATAAGPAALGLGGLIGGGIVLGAGAGLLVAVKAMDQYAESQRIAIETSKELRNTSSDLGLSFSEIAASAKAFNDQTGASKSIYAESLRLSHETTVSSNDLAKAIVNVANARGVDQDRLAISIAKMTEGQAVVELFGRNGVGIFDLYAASIGKTAEQLTELEKRQALANGLLEQNALTAEKAANNNNTLAKSWTSLLEGIGGAISPGVKAFLDAVNRAGAGGGSGQGAPQKEIGVLDAFFSNIATGASWSAGERSRLTGNAERIYAEALDTANQNDKKFFDEYKKQYFANVQKAAQDLSEPNKNLVALATSKFIDFDKFVGMAPDQQKQAQLSAVAKAKEFLTVQKKAFEDTVASGDAGSIRKSLLDITKLQGAFEPKDFKTITDSASRSLAASYRESLDGIKNSLPDLQKLLSSVSNDSGLSGGDRFSLGKSIRTAIEADIKEAKKQVEDLAKKFDGLFEDLVDKRGTSNPIFMAINEGDRAMDKLRENAKGLSSDLQKTLEEMQKNASELKLFETRLDNSLKAFDLRDQAARFRDYTPLRRDLRDKAVNLDIANINRTGGLRGRNSELIIRNLNARLRLFSDDPAKKAQERLDEQLKIIDNSVSTVGATEEQQKLNEEKRALAQSRTISIASTLDPKDLRADQREAVARAFEDKAVRMEKYEIEAQKARIGIWEIMKQKQKDEARQKEAAKTDGTKGVADLHIKLTNESDSDVHLDSRPQNPTPDATARLYGFNMVRGSNR